MSNVEILNFTIDDSKETLNRNKYDVSWAQKNYQNEYTEEIFPIILTGNKAYSFVETYGKELIEELLNSVLPFDNHTLLYGLDDAPVNAEIHIQFFYKQETDYIVLLKENDETCETFATYRII